MRVLLDTHVLVWWARDDPRLGSGARHTIRTATDACVSIVTAWEIAIKRGLGKLEAPDDLDQQLQLKRFTELPVHLRHVNALSRLPDLHRDPFDRILVAQCLRDDLVMVSHDEHVLAYPMKSLRAT